MASKKTNPNEPALRPSFIYGGIALLVVAAGFAVYNFVLAGGGGSSEPSPPATVTTNQAAAPAPRSSAAPKAASPKEIGLFEGRDPFKPLVTEVKASESAPAATPAPAPSTPAPTPQPSATPAPSTTNGTTIEVVSVAEDQSAATIRVGDKVYDRAKPRDVLEGNFVVDRIENSCVTFHKGSDPSFQVCQGQKVVK